MRDLGIAAAVVVGLTLASACCGDKRGDEAGYRVFAIEYAHSPKLRASGLVHEAPKDRFTPFSWYAWVVRGKGRVVLVDTGFDEVGAAKGFGVERFTPVPELLGGLGIRPEQVTDLIITHLHFDHAGNAAPYTKAKLWIQRAELDWGRKRVDAKRPRRGGVRLEDVRFLASLEGAGRLSLVDGDAEVVEGISVHRGGGHTPGLQWVEVRTGTATGTVVLAADNAYLYENLSERRPTASTRDKEGDLLLFDELLRTASRRDLAIPGHDPKVMREFPEVAPFVVELR
jgi:glyoxylase-like metal-dependent hydrolase (beta-lactamase superfamily II)